MPAAPAAAASARSPSGQSRPLNPVGPIPKGSAIGLPSSVVDRSTDEMSRKMRGAMRKSSKAARLPVRARSSSAPPSRYSAENRGRRRSAMARRSSMDWARATGPVETWRRRGREMAAGAMRKGRLRLCAAHA